MIKRFIKYYRPHLKLFFVDLLSAFTLSVLGLAYPMITREIINVGIKDKNMELLISYSILLLIIFIAMYFLEYVVTYWGHVLGLRIQYDMRRDLFSHLQKLSFNFFDNSKIGHLMSRIINDLFEISELAHHGPEDLFISLIKVVGAFIILMFINIKLTLISFSIIPIMVYFMIYYNNKLEMAFKKAKEKIADVNSRIEESLAGIRVVKSFTNEEYEIERFNYGNELFKNVRAEAFKYLGTFYPTINFLGNMAILIMIFVGGIFVYNGDINVGDFIAYNLFVGQFLQPLKVLLRFVEMYQQGAAGFRRFLEIMDTEAEIIDKENAIELKNVKGEIVFENVGFSYDEGKKVLHNINLHVSAGETIAIVGPSGGGKTTLCSLIPRFYDITEGSIKIDGIDIRDIKIKSLRRNIGLVQQDVFLFSGTIRDNIRYGRMDATDEEIIEAAKAANAHEFILELSDGYDTLIGERGIKLSGGQKQRIAIARMFLKNPPILILDEATSSLDNQSEAIIQKSIEKLSKNRTTFIIAHRLATVKHAKRIIVLTENGIVEEGTHEELMDKKGEYYKLYNAQFESLLI
ncbi:ABC transporter ATP-binding protein [Marinitoga litoralis]|uniref:ABC transporter ATP-binding protein n=1 Tax=Marinitoga litoralis TaxID=570855 RepID=UPI0019607F4D|nr:ABC transporter ATP-binding protein [Marinitoga litoralis]MBM7559066.1 ATP-binding cassette subfamily B protein [Marinitoga litoralis]